MKCPTFLPRFSAAALLLLGLFALAGADRLPATAAAPTLDQLWQSYEDRLDHKAFAAARGEGLGVWAMASGEPSQQRAVQSALTSCQARVRSAGVEAPCVLVAIGDRVLEPELTR